MFEIITFGSATWDIFLREKKFQVTKNKKFLTGKGICFNLGSKLDVEDVYFFSGGGGTNTAAAFSRQGFKTAYCGRIGADLAGKEIIRELKRFRVRRRFLYRTKLKPSNLSIVLNSDSEKDRTILVYRGASELFGKKDIPWKKLKAKWFYLAPFSGKLCKITEDIVNFAYKNKIKIVFNPGNCQLSLLKKVLERILKRVDILVLNQEEASLLTKTPFQKEKEIFNKIDKICPGIAIMTKGAKGAVVSDGRYLYQAKPSKIKVVDRTGAGDSFGSGFVSGFMKSNGDMEFSIQMAIANANSCLKKWGAKDGLLEKREGFLKVKVRKTII